MADNSQYILYFGAARTLKYSENKKNWHIYYFSCKFKIKKQNKKKRLKKNCVKFHRRHFFKVNYVNFLKYLLDTYN